MTIAALELLTFGLGRLVTAARESGHRLCLLTRDRAVYRHELDRLPPDALDIVDVDTLDTAACVAALGALPDLAGLINSTDTFGITGADAAAALGLPGPDPEAVRLVRDKYRVRTLLHGLGLGRVPAHRVADPSPAAATGVLRAVGLPAVLKDTAGTSSRAVWPVRDEPSLRAALAEAAHTPLKGGLLAEPFLSGPVYSAETLTWAGHTTLLGVTSRQMSPEPAVREEAAAFPVMLDTAARARIETWVGTLLAAVGHDAGFAHTEFVATTEGPELVEINRRIGGALVGEALCRRLGINVYAAEIDLALGRRPALLDTPQAAGPACGFVLVYAPAAGTLTGWRGLDGLAAFPGAPRWYPTLAPGDRITALGDQRACTGILLAEGPTAELALHRALAAAGGVRPLIDTPDAPSPV
ncbi:ATP-grasp domain-containing protein [Streptomyces sp. NPDC059853]|uniref:ATP-grasp domain-containing protein n=1 Tax=Streptomyces sp. NPDC059853 TaxID=3346973 RepID=UPI003663FFF0